MEEGLMVAVAPTVDDLRRLVNEALHVVEGTERVALAATGASGRVWAEDLGRMANRAWDRLLRSLRSGDGDALTTRLREFVAITVPLQDRPNELEDEVSKVEHACSVLAADVSSIVPLITEADGRTRTAAWVQNASAMMLQIADEFHARGQFGA